MRMKVSVMGLEHELVIDDEELRKQCEKWEYDSETTQGLFCKWERQMFVANSMEDEQKAQTLVHEALHAIGSLTGQMSLAHSTTKNELFVDAVASGIVSLLKNKELYRLLGKLLGHSP